MTDDYLELFVSLEWQIRINGKAFPHTNKSYSIDITNDTTEKEIIDGISKSLNERIDKWCNSDHKTNIHMFDREGNEIRTNIPYTDTLKICKKERNK